MFHEKCQIWPLFVAFSLQIMVILALREHLSFKTFSSDRFQCISTPDDWGTLWRLCQVTESKLSTTYVWTGHNGLMKEFHWFITTNNVQHYSYTYLYKRVVPSVPSWNLGRLWLEICCSKYFLCAYFLIV